YHCSPAGGHGHGHYTNYATYDLLDASEAVVAEGGKLGFCLIDSSCDVGIPSYVSCDFQGLSAGCSDLYDVSLGCQYIEVTGLPDGEYTLRITVDPLGEITESNETNNAALFAVTLGDGSSEPDEALAGTSVQLATRSAGGTKLRLKAEPDAAIALPAPGHAPTDGGATLEVSDAAAPGSTLSLSLPAERWEGLGRPAGTAGYRFRGGKHDACKSARLDGDGLRARCQGTGLALPVGGALDVVFTSGDAKRYCARFGGTERRNDAKRLRRVDAASAACPEPAP
ncbi:MAG TPA: lysyl oxidase family protein, partial [Myxococcota bacterium]|nr:lysyl oxidase family protein [Myxococcota bacterium]